MDNNYLIDMVNQIGVFFELMFDCDEVLIGIVEYIWCFWELWMCCVFFVVFDDLLSEVG